jgi:hypothetical protein
LSILGIIPAPRSSKKTTLRPRNFALGQKERTTQNSQLSWGEWRAKGCRATPQGRAVANQNNGNLAQKEMQISRSEWESVVTDWFPFLFFKGTRLRRWKADFTDETPACRSGSSGRDLRRFFFTTGGTAGNGKTEDRSLRKCLS